MNSLESLSAHQLRQAAGIKEKIQTLENQLNRLLGAAPAAAPRTGQRTMSAAAKARISAAMKKRWAKVKSGKAPAKSAKKSSKRKMSPAAKAKLSARMKQIWAQRKAGK